MARRSSRPSYGRHNYDRRDGLKVNRLHDNRQVSRYTTSVSMWDLDNVVMDNPDGTGFVHVSVAKELRRLNTSKCKRVNGYNGKINGRM